MKFLTIIIAFIIFVAVNAVLENNKLLVKELDHIEKAQRDCVKEKLTEEQCAYKCALEKLKYETTSHQNTERYRHFCKRNVSAIENECEKHQEFVYCLHREVQNEVNKIRDKCAEKFKVDINAFRYLHLQEIIESQDYACFMFCFQKGIGKMNDDLTFNYNDEEMKKIKINLTAVIEECAEKSESQTSKCSKAAHRVYCLEEKLH